MYFVYFNSLLLALYQVSNQYYQWASSFW